MEVREVSETYVCRNCGRDATYVDHHGVAECDECIAAYDEGEWRAERARGK